MTKESVMALLAEINDENSGRDLVSAGAVREVVIHEDRVSVKIRLGYPIANQGLELADLIKTRLESDADIVSASINISFKVMPHKVQNDLKPLKSIANIIVVGSGKGGVGKSTTAINLALALQGEGARVGLLDADIYGPSIPTMLGVKGQPSTDGKKIIPKQAHGLHVMSIGFLVDEDTAMIWRGPRWGSRRSSLSALPLPSMRSAAANPRTNRLPLRLGSRCPIATQAAWNMN